MLIIFSVENSKKQKIDYLKELEYKYDIVKIIWKELNTYDVYWSAVKVPPLPQLVGVPY